MASKQSAGILLYRGENERTEVLLVHPGGPFWVKKDLGAWFIPKGELEPGEDALTAAYREFFEELGSRPPAGEALELGTVKNKSGKLISAWAIEGDLDLAAVKSTTFALEWPPKSGKLQDFPEVDRACFFTLDEARVKLHSAELPLLERLVVTLTSRATGS